MNRRVCWLVALGSLALACGPWADPCRGALDDSKALLNSPLDIPRQQSPVNEAVKATENATDLLRDEAAFMNSDPNRRQFRPKQPEPGYSEIRPYSNSALPNRIKPLKESP